MLRITCPHCGTRSIDEFVHGEILAPPESLTDQADIDFDRAYFHNNEAGPVREAWFHLYGCRRWIVITRDTVTDKVL